MSKLRAFVAVAATSLLVADAQASIPFPSYNGNIDMSPQIITLYWGDFTQAQINTMQAYLQGLADYMTGVGASRGNEPTLFQYSVYGATLGVSATDTTMPKNNGISGHTTEAGMDAEIASLQSSGKLPAFNAQQQQLFVVFMHGITIDTAAPGLTFCNAGAVNCDTCAWNDGTGPSGAYHKAVLPYPVHNTCTSTVIGGVGPFDAAKMWQVWTSHEIMENAASGWTSAVGPQIADGDCQYRFDPKSFGPVQRVADNQHLSCTTETYEQLAETTVVSTQAARLDVFVRGASDHRMWRQSWNGSAWLPTNTTWEDHGGNLITAPAAVSWGSNRIDVFGQGTDGAYYHQWWDGNAWGPAPGTTNWEYHGGPSATVPKFIGPPALSTWGANRLDVFGRGADGALYHQWWDGSAWGPSGITSWENQGGVTVGPPAPISRKSGIVDVFMINGPNGHMVDSSYDGVKWTWVDHGGVFTSPPVVVSKGPNRLDIFGLATDGTVYHQWLDNGVWGPSGIQSWESHGAKKFRRTPAATEVNGVIHLVGEGTDGKLYHQSSNGFTWSPSLSTWESHSGSFASAPAIAAWDSTRLDIFAPDSTTGKIQHQWRTGTTWGPSKTTYEDRNAPAGGVQ